MNKYAIPLALAAVALVSACAHRAAPAPIVVVPQQPAVVASPTTPMVVVQPTALRAGYGRIESISTVPTAAGAGSTAASSMRRFGIKMEDGTVQYVDSDTPSSVGERVQLTGDGYIRPAP
jgi:hypothetical protein